MCLKNINVLFELGASGTFQSGTKIALASEKYLFSNSKKKNLSSFIFSQYNFFSSNFKAFFLKKVLS